MRHRSFFGTAATLALLLPFTVACGDDEPTGPGDDEGTARAVVTDDPNAAGTASVSPDGAALSQSFSGATFDGTFTGQVRAEVSADGQTWIDLGPAQSVNVAMQSGQEAVVHASTSVPARTYSHVRLIVSGGQATLVSGTVGTLPITAQVQIMVDGGSEFTIEKTMNVEIDADSETKVVFDLNSENWIDEANVNSQTATAAEVASATSVRIQ